MKKIFSFISNLSLVAMIAFALAGVSAEASQWNRVELKSASGWLIQVNYKEANVSKYNGLTAVLAAPLWINVLKPTSGTVQAILITRKFSKNSSSQPYVKFVSSQQIDLVSRANDTRNRSAHFVPGHYVSYAGEAKSDVVIDDANYYYEQELAFVDEKEHWQVDLINGSSNFRINLKNPGRLR